MITNLLSIRTLDSTVSLLEGYSTIPSLKPNRPGFEDIVLEPQDEGRCHYRIRLEFGKNNPELESCQATLCVYGTNFGEPLNASSPLEHRQTKRMSFEQLLTHATTPTSRSPNKYFTKWNTTGASDWGISLPEHLKTHFGGYSIVGQLYVAHPIALVEPERDIVDFVETYGKVVYTAIDLASQTPELLKNTN